MTENGSMAVVENNNKENPEIKKQDWELHKDRGNFLFKNGRYKDAVDEYKKGIESDPNISVLYANRAMAMLKLDRNEDVIKDCDKAIQLDANQVKAYYRKALALLKLKRYEEARTQLRTVLKLEPKNSGAKKELGIIDNTHMFHGVHAQIGGLSSAVRVEWDETKGRKLVAAQQIPAGALLLREQAMAWIISQTSANILCQNCCRQLPTKHIKCADCKTTRFCNEKCLKEAKESFHSLECQTGFTPNTDVEKMALLAQRVLMSTVDNGEKLDKDLDDFSSTFGTDPDDKYGANLKSVLSLGDKAMVDITDYEQAIEKTAVGKPEFMKHCKLESKDRVHEIMMQLITKVHLNHASQSSPSVELPDEQAINAFYVVYALTNHSCLPNMFRQTEGRTVELRAVRLIHEGEELTTTYGPEFPLQPKGERQALLRYHYGFDCDCPPCTTKVYERKELAILSYHCRFCPGRAVLMPGKKEKIVCVKCMKAQPYTKERVNILPDMITEEEQTSEPALKLLQSVGCSEERMNTEPCVHSLKTLHGYVNYYAYCVNDMNEAVDVADHMIKMANGLYGDTPHFAIEYYCTALRILCGNFAEKHGAKIAELFRHLLRIFVQYFGCTQARVEWRTQLLDEQLFDKYFHEALPIETSAAQTLATN